MTDSMLSPKEITTTLKNIAEKKAQAQAWELVFLGILAGIYIGFGAFAATTVLSWGGMPVGFAKFLAGSVFTVGLMLVIIPGSELFTGNILMSISFVRYKMPLKYVLKNWSFVYIGNFVGSLILAAAIFYAGFLGDGADPSAQGLTAIKIATAKMALPFGQAFLRGVLCNMLVCLAVIMAVASPSVIGKIFSVYFPIMVFVASGYEHSIANMFFLPAGLMAEGRLLTGFWSMFGNLIPVTLGNIVGGLLVVLLHPGQLRRLMRSSSEHKPAS